MDQPLFLKFLPASSRQNLANSLSSRFSLSGSKTVLPNGKLVTNTQKTTPNTDLSLTLDNLGFGYPLKTVSRPAVDRFERITGVSLNAQLRPGWKTEKTTADTISDSQWLAKLLKRSRINNDRTTFNDAQLSNPERFNLLRQLRQSITDVFEGFISPRGKP